MACFDFRRGRWGTAVEGPDWELSYSNQSSPWLLLSNTKVAMENGQGCKLHSRGACSVTSGTSVWVPKEPHCPSAGTLVGYKRLGGQRAPVLLPSHRLTIFQQEVNHLVWGVFHPGSAALEEPATDQANPRTGYVCVAGGEGASLKGRTLYCRYFSPYWRL